MISLNIDGPYNRTSFPARLGAAAEHVDSPDSYGEGPAIQECEDALARALGKEKAVLFATGTLANLLVLDRLCGPRRRRVLLHPDSHVLNDTGDSLAILGLTPAVAAAAGAGFVAEALDEAVARARSGRVAQAIGAVCIETPVRRRRNEIFPEAMLAAVVAASRRHGIGLHLDGARLPIAAAGSGRSMAAVAAEYDTVYLSLWKTLGLPFGAVLAGPAALLSGIEHDRRRMGGALPQFWPLAAVVLAELHRLEPEWADVFVWIADLRARMSASEPLEVETVGSGATNTLWLRPRSIAADLFKSRCGERGVLLGDVDEGRVLLRANPTVLIHDAAEIALTLDAAARAT